MKKLAGGIGLTLAILWAGPAAAEPLPAGQQTNYYIPAPPRDDPDSVEGEAPPEEGVTDPMDDPPPDDPPPEE